MRGRTPIRTRAFDRGTCEESQGFSGFFGVPELSAGCRGRLPLLFQAIVVGKPSLADSSRVSIFG
jgi:hypothetical protein